MGGAETPAYEGGDMRRRLVIICFGVCLAAGLFTWFVVRPYRVSMALSEHMRGGPGTIVDFASIAPFAWDRVYFFGPYTDDDYIDRSLGFHWGGVKWSGIGSGKGVNLVVFVQDEAVVHSFDHSRLEELGALVNPRGYARDEARFTVYRSTDNRLALAPPQQ
jgi:hypothetical protein